MNTLGTKLSSRPAVTHSLAIVGFVSLVSLGVWLAIYSTRFVPQTVGRIGAAAVYLGAIFKPAPESSLSVVPTASTTIPFGEASSTVSTSATHATQTNATPVPIAGERTTNTTQIGGTSSAALSGLPDLVVHIDTIGYLTTSSTDSFIASSTVPNGSRPAVKFTVKNIGTNATGAWRFSASIPTSSNPIYQSAVQQSLNPGDYIEYSLGFDQAVSGAGKMISVTANFDHTVTESNPNNNSASAQVTILGS